ncbi:AAA family ATPase [Pseudomonas cannabina pv. alisalensis]|uniref:AAA family ATPase n=1 Tax=Pseudomonas syringae pv. maculicola str. ES4326 TaxID=629265 RepID=A0A8T8C107_PSEYM|nr:MULTISPECIES: AAA domain-containing protein [Pseudomonas syringae group]QHE97310.1 AAA family ATPase [Pseudomonas syringae pv. maculicola str. ES4326]UBY97978.1 AAA family ATPase [Pseudomonas cannabina pv. alisalensis]
MDVRYWEGGLLSFEIDAIDKIAKAFGPKVLPSGHGSGSKGKSFDVLRQLKRPEAGHDVWPWRGYAGFRFANSRGSDGEFDLVIITHSIVLVVELKHWRGEITNHGGKWHQDGKETEVSPVDKTRRKTFELRKRFKGIKSRLRNGKEPWIDFCIVLTGDCTVNLPDVEMQHVMLLNDFLEMADPKRFKDRFNARSNIGLNEHFGFFDGIINEGTVKPKELVVDDYRAQSQAMFIHPTEVYREYDAVNIHNKDDRAMVRLWDFSKLNDTRARTAEGRYRILSRERDVMIYLRLRDQELMNRCARPKRNASPDSVTEQYAELLEMPEGHYRLNEFINRFVERMKALERVQLFKILLGQFAGLHRFNIAHRDLGDHSVWFSPSSSIALSNFISAYYQPVGTLGDLRTLLSIGAIALPEDQDTAMEGSTPFCRDVFALGLMGWHLFQARPMPLKLNVAYVASIQAQVESSEEWPAKVLMQALQSDPKERFDHSGAFQQALSESTPDNSASFEFDNRRLDVFSTDLRLSSAYREDDDPMADTAEKLIYRSGALVVKSWPSINARDPKDGQGPMLMAFFGVLEQLKGSGFAFLPKIEHFGYDRSGNPFLAQQHIEGKHWDELKELSVDTRLVVTHGLIEAIEGLHGQQLGHGDLHPHNVKVNVGSTPENTQVYLLDCPDFSVSGASPVNTRYSPVLENCTPAERDNFAVMRMVFELLEMDWDVPSAKDIPSLRAAVAHEMDTESGFLSLERFKDALDAAFTPAKTVETVSVVIRNRSGEVFEILPDNGKVFVVVKPDPRAPTKALEVTFAGVGGQLMTGFNPASNQFINAFRANQEMRVPPYLARQANHHIQARLSVSGGASVNVHELTKLLSNDEAFLNLAAQVHDAEVRKQTSIEGGESVADSITCEDEDNGLVIDEAQLEAVKVRSFPVSQIWKTITTTELEAQPSFRVSEEPHFHKDGLGLLIPYAMDAKALEGFEAGDNIRLILREGEKDIDIGEINLGMSVRSAVYVLSSSRSKRVQTGSQLFLQSQQNKTSMARRRGAMERILNRQSVLPDLMDYFDEKCKLAPRGYTEEPTDADFAVYERTTASGAVIGLNEAQRAAFTQLITTGPVGLLQGPPGTGKTEFIAAFIHYLISKVGVRNILLVSQSHEAVNTAAERIRAHCRRLNTELNVVRFSNRDQVVSEELLDVYSRNIVDRQRNGFSAELKERVGYMASSLGLGKAFVQTMVDVNQGVFKLVRSLKKLDEEIRRTQADGPDRKSLQTLKSSLLVELNLNASSFLGELVEGESLPQNLLERIYDHVQTVHGVRAPELKHCLELIQLSQEYVERLSSNRANYDEFLMRSRTLVCGTCVGIGLQHLKLAETHFDWVIIDEAARSAPSELAIAMQVGSRVLLVGDHNQLRPTYEEEHKAAIARSLGVTTGSAEFQHVMRSDFERVFQSPYGRATRATLNTQYRMLPAIGDLVNDIFYDIDLKNGFRPSPRYFSQKVPECLSHVVTWVDTSELGKKAYDSGTLSLSNNAEAEAIIQLLEEIAEDTEFCAGMAKEMAESQEPPIGVICMYLDQRKLVRKRFAEKSWSEEFRKLVKIETVDSYQGKENNIIIVSLTRAKADQSTGFLATPNRINVAMSRAMERLVIVGSLRMWNGRNARLPLGQVASFIQAKQDTINYCIKSVKPAKRVV